HLDAGYQGIKNPKGFMKRQAGKNKQNLYKKKPSQILRKHNATKKKITHQKKRRKKEKPK
ncbi:hypothetical protein ACNIV9_28690, partial [Escherichia coli]